MNVNLKGSGKYIEKIKPVLAKIGKKIVKIINIVVEKIKLFAKKISTKLTELYGNKKWFKKAASQLSTVKINRPNFNGKGMRIDGYRTRDTRVKRIRLVLSIIVVIVILALGINFTIKARRASIVHNQASQIFTSTEVLVKKAENMATSDKNAAEVAIYQAKNALKETPTNISEKDLIIKNNLDTRILVVEDSLYKRVGLNDHDGKLATFIDSRLSFGDNSSPTDIEIYSDDSGNEYLLITDKGLNAVF